MGSGGVIIIHFLEGNGLIILGHSYDNIEWGPGKIREKKMSPPTRWVDFVHAVMN